MSGLISLGLGSPASIQFLLTLGLGVGEDAVVVEDADPIDGVSDLGIHFTHPWEGSMGEIPGEVVQYRFPENFGALKFIAYDREPIGVTSRKAVQSQDPSYITREGIPHAYYPLDGIDLSFALYPRPSTNWVNELDGEGLAITVSGDEESGDEGTIATRSGDADTQVGVSVDSIGVDDSLFMVYSVSPAAVRNGQDEPDYPDYLRKYIRYGVAARAYGANTDGRIKSLSEYWGMRYDLGVQFVKRFMRMRRQDRDYRLTTKGVRARRNYRHPRLPDGYPAV